MSDKTNRARHYWMLKGYLIGQNAPPEIVAAAKGLLAAGQEEISQVISGPPVKVEAPRPQDEPQIKPKRGWSPEAKAAAAERMRARHAEGKMGRNPERDHPPGEAPAPLPSLAGGADF